MAEASCGPRPTTPGGAAPACGAGEATGAAGAGAAEAAAAHLGPAPGPPGPPPKPPGPPLATDAGPPAGKVPLVAWPSVSNAHTDGAASSARERRAERSDAHPRELNATSANTASAPTTISTGGSHGSCPG